MRVVFLGSAPFATPVLAHLLASAFRPVAVVTPPDRPRGRGRAVSASLIAALASDASIELLRPARASDPAFLDLLRAREPDVCLVASYGELLTQDFLDVPAVATLNVHGSLLPRWRGASPVQAAILAGDRVTGVTIQRVVLALDAGDVLHALETPIGERETGGELFARLAELGGRAAVEALALVASGEARYEPQDEARVTACRKLKKNDGRIDWARPADELERLVRALNPWPSARTTLPDGRELSVHRAQRLGDAVSTAPLGDAAGTQPGTILDASGRLVVAAGAGALALLEVQLAGKTTMDAGAFLRGARLTAGERLGVGA